MEQDPRPLIFSQHNVVWLSGYKLYAYAAARWSMLQTLAMCEIPLVSAPRYYALQERHQFFARLSSFRQVR